MTEERDIDEMLAELDGESGEALEGELIEDPVRAMQALLDEHCDPRIHEVQDPREKRVIEELTHIGHSNIAELFVEETILEYAGEDDEGEDILEPTTRLTVANLKELPEHVQRAIKKVKITGAGAKQVIEVEMHDKLVALDKLMRHYGLYERDNDQGPKSAAESVLDLMFGRLESRGLPRPIPVDSADD